MGTSIGGNLIASIMNNATLAFSAKRDSFDVFGKKFEFNRTSPVSAQVICDGFDCGIYIDNGVAIMPQQNRKRKVG